MAFIQFKRTDRPPQLPFMHRKGHKHYSTVTAKKDTVIRRLQSLVDKAHLYLDWFPLVCMYALFLPFVITTEENIFLFPRRLFVVYWNHKVTELHFSRLTPIYYTEALEGIGSLKCSSGAYQTSLTQLIKHSLISLLLSGTSAKTGNQVLLLNCLVPMCSHSLCKNRIVSQLAPPEPTEGLCKAPAIICC